MPTIIAGKFKGRHLASPKNKATRPTMGRNRQVLFDKLIHGYCSTLFSLQDAVVLDGFAGTGAFGLEALSRGARFAIFCDKDRQIFQILKKNVALCHAQNQSCPILCDIIYGNLPRIQQKATIIFLDPPYRRELITPALQSIIEKKYLTDPALVILETQSQEPLPIKTWRIEEKNNGKNMYQLRLIDQAKLKNTNFTFWYFTTEKTLAL